MGQEEREPELQPASAAPLWRKPADSSAGVSSQRGPSSGPAGWEFSAGGLEFLGLRNLSPPSRKTSEFSTRRSAMDSGAGRMKRMFHQWRTCRDLGVPNQVRQERNSGRYEHSQAEASGQGVEAGTEAEDPGRYLQTQLGDGSTHRSCAVVG